MRKFFFWSLRSFLFSVVVGLTVAALTPELRCCLTLTDCDRCNAVEQLPAGWRAKTILVSNHCAMVEHIKVRYEGGDGEIHITPWQSIEPRSDAYLKGDDGRQLVSYGASYGFKRYATSPDELEAAPPASLKFETTNVFNEIRAWQRDETRLSIKGC